MIVRVNVSESVFILHPNLLSNRKCKILDFMLQEETDCKEIKS